MNLGVISNAPSCVCRASLVLVKHCWIFSQLYLGLHAAIYEYNPLGRNRALVLGGHPDLGRYRVRVKGRGRSRGRGRGRGRSRRRFWGRYVC